MKIQEVKFQKSGVLKMIIIYIEGDARTHLEKGTVTQLKWYHSMTKTNEEEAKKGESRSHKQLKTFSYLLKGAICFFCLL